MKNKKNKFFKRVMVISFTLIILCCLAVPCFASYPLNNAYGSSSLPVEAYSNLTYEQIRQIYDYSYSYFISNPYIALSYTIPDSNNVPVYRYDMLYVYLYISDSYDYDRNFKSFLFSQTFWNICSSEIPNFVDLDVDSAFDSVCSYQFPNLDFYIISEDYTVNLVNEDLYFVQFLSYYDSEYNYDLFRESFYQQFYFMNNTSEALYYYNLYEELESNYSDDISNAYNNGYNNGLSIGYSNALTDTDSFQKCIYTIFDAPFQFLRNVFSFDLFGINIYSIVITIISIALTAFVVKLVL